MKKFKDSKKKLDVTFDSHDWACLHDCVYNATKESYSQKKLEKIFDKLPEVIKFTAFQWGMSDTVFRDEVFEHLKLKEKLMLKEKQNSKVNTKKTPKRKPMWVLAAGHRGIGKSSIA